MSINAKSYIKPEKSDAISKDDESEGDPDHKVTFNNICKEINGFNETQRRFKRFAHISLNISPYTTEQFLGHLQDLFKYACFNGDLLSCGVTLARILPYRFYIDMNHITGDFFE